MAVKKISSLVAVVLLLWAARANADGIVARGAAVMNLKSSSMLYVQDADKRVPPASLTKIMTMYLVNDALAAKKIRLSDVVRVSKRAAAARGATMGLKAGERVRVEDLIRGVCVGSANDAAVAIAEHVAGSEQRFVAMMNARAAKLGMKNTRYRNAHGLPPAEGQYTTARDMLTLSRAYMNAYPGALKYHSMTEFLYKGRRLTNKNRLLGVVDGADGLKSGWIRASGFNLVSTAKRGSVRILCVILGSKTPERLAEDSAFMIEAAFKTVASGGKDKIVYQLRALEEDRAAAISEDMQGPKQR